MKSSYLLTIFLVAILAGLFLAFASKSMAPTKAAPKKLTVGSTTINVEIADTPEKTTLGLSNRKNLSASSGMYFVFNERKQQTFWMKDMLFPLDIIWIDTVKVVGIEKNCPIPTADNIPTFNSPGPVTNVLEVNAGFSEINNIKEGDSIALIK